MQIGIIGLGKMGSRLGLKLLQEGHEVVVWNRSVAPIEELQIKYQKSPARNASQSDAGGNSKNSNQKLKIAQSVEDLIRQLDKPRIVWLMLPAGEATESVLSEVLQYVEPEDIVIDGGNAHFTDTDRRSKALSAKGIRFLGIGVSGGIHALENGYPLMVGGSFDAYQHIIPLLDSLTQPNGGHQYFGEGGAGHFVKMVHNGIEYGMMQAVGEGFGVLEKAPYDIDLSKVSQLWQRGTILSGFLIDRAKDALEKDPKLTGIVGEIAASGEGEWTVEQGKKEEVPVENIEQALVFRKRTQTDSSLQDTFAAKLVAALRHEFGGHSVKKKI